ncbi:protein cornichon homolog 4-like isoform X1 [Amphibalanus amphitrite]|nr:protein cornichon homolog 4-like isoform X3 [Amphibalanus amphitrite]XP_043226261.1 protein cornichon homolog 4-like isoform X3 [Amphibalanus amphitrite]XP_043226262.1 protein cornichon homolog 4-like isoform X3 [Amphibalanus amphitrite]XP_043226263.1 protein cornichon homolog 4-like isoform X3 [Amphibalanus amphitrite]XP_043226264.1 protein cornichon homolog 4-like isoform X3 [Amphibalanus amphitrite]XP_043226265.1 protein cornichon homolog 4-like isoform X3 [Amphibalanus amphitrite]XP_04
MKTLDTITYSFSMMDNGAILLLLVYFLITLSDLECDYLNARECCSKLNWWTPWLLGGQALLSVVLLFSGHWLLWLLNVPVLVWLVYRQWSVRPGNIGIYDPADILNGGQLQRHTRNTMVFITFYLIFFFVYLYLFILALLQTDEKPPPPIYEPRHL